MEKKHVYPLKFNKWIYLLVPLAMLLTIPVIIMNIINISHMSGTDGYNIALDAVAIVLSAVILFLTLSCVFFARYSVKNNSLYCALGLFFLKVKASSILGITRYTHVDKLSVFFKNRNIVKQIVVSIDPQLFDDFIDALKGLNKDISYYVDSDDYDEK